MSLDVLKISRDPSLAMAKLINTTSTLDIVNMSQKEVKKQIQMQVQEMVKGQAVDDKNIDGDTIKFLAMFKALNSNHDEVYHKIKESKLTHNQIIAYINNECSLQQLT